VLAQPLLAALLPATRRAHAETVSTIYHAYSSSLPSPNPGGAMPAGGTPALNVAKVFDLAYGGIQNFIGQNDIVLLRPNLQWNQNGYTNTDIAKAMTDLILNRPGGFSGEIIYVENTYRATPDSYPLAETGWHASNKSSNGPYNWFELVQYYIDNAASYPNGIHTDPTTGKINVSFMFLDQVNNRTLGSAAPIPSQYYGTVFHRASGTIDGTVNPFLRLKNNMAAQTTNGLFTRSDLVYSLAAGARPGFSPTYVYNPRFCVFKSRHSGLYISPFEAYPTAWDPATETFTAFPVKFINMTTLNHHSNYAGVTSVVKGYMAITEATSYPHTAGSFHPVGGTFGWLMNKITSAHLHMVCAERVGTTNRQMGAGAPYARSIAISTDPIALDLYAGKYILYPRGGLYGQGGGSANNADTNNPDLNQVPGSYYGQTIDWARSPMADGSIINGTLDESKIAVVKYDFNNPKVTRADIDNKIRQMKAGLVTQTDVDALIEKYRQGQ
jgi:hypothetical protein